jgi:YD repeat-containing protein
MSSSLYIQKSRKVRMYYDPRGQVAKTVNPDNTQQRVIFGVPNDISTLPDSTYKINKKYKPSPWESYTYDANDLAPITHPSGSGVPIEHTYTPKSSLVDTLGRTIKTIDRLGANANDEVAIKYEYDLQGNLLRVTDALDRTVFQHTYDLAKQSLKTFHIDSGISRSLADAQGKPIEGSDAKDARTLASYDTLSRPVSAWAQNNGSDTLRMILYNRYGEEASSPEDNNLLGKLWEQYDEAGKLEMNEYDFKGMLLSKTRKVISDATLKAELDNYNSFLVDWTGLPDILDTFEYETTNEYDALNRVVKITLPENVETDRKEIIPSYNNAGALEKVSYDGTEYVKHIAYNAKGQRLLIALGNGVMTRYCYDANTFRLKRQRSEKYIKSQTGNTITYEHQSGTNRQDDGFDYDLTGNILRILHRINDCGIDGTLLGSDALDRTFTYDPLNRLTSASGRESDTQNENDYLYADVPAPGSPNASNVRAYTRLYQYDKLGNVLQVKQTGTNGFTRNFVYSSGVNTLQKVEDNSSTLIEDFTYDNAGNQLTAGTTRHYEWTAANQLLII